MATSGSRRARRSRVTSPRSRPRVRPSPLTSLGFVGLGWWATELAQAANRAGLAVAAGCEPDPARLSAFCERFGAKGYPDLDAMLAAPSVSAVVIATPHSRHGGQAIAAAGAGKAVFVEKPFTLNAAEGQSVIEACRAAGVTLAVGHNRRLLSGFAQIQTMVASGRLGKLQAVEATYATPEALGFDPRHWRSQLSECPLGPMTVLGPHMLDWMLTLLGPAEGASVAISSPRPDRLTPDAASMALRFASGVVGSLTCLYASAYDCRFTLHGDRATARLIATRPDSPTDRPSLTVTDLDGAIETMDAPWVDSLALELKAFADGAPVVDGDAALATVRLLEAAQAAKY